MTAAATELFANAGGVAAAIRRAQAQLRPPPDLKPSAWVEQNVRIPAGNAVPGPMRLDNAPYQREPLDMLVAPDCYRETLMWGAQVGKTMTALGIQGYSIASCPRSQMMMQPSQGDLNTWLETKFNPLIEANAGIRRLVARPRGRNGVNNRQMKSYPGGFIMFAWSGSPKTMRGRSAPLIVCDEVDGYEVTEEGHPVGLLWQRAATFGDMRFLLEISTPTTKAGSLASGATLSVTGIFEDTTLNTHTGEYEIDLANPRLECSFAEVAAVSRFDTVLIDGTSYKVADLPRNDGSGWGIIRLAPLDPPA
ncbi:MAG: phage terminase large subunit family protein [Acidocella sp.]|nr:phage terminase large subunit family protein [Acidocella sp.]